MNAAARKPPQLLDDLPARSSKRSQDDRPIIHDDGHVEPIPTRLPSGRRPWISACILEFGFAVIGGCAAYRKDRLIVSHTIGMTKRGLPEFAISGIPAHWAHSILSEFVAHLPPGETIPPEEDALMAEGMSSGYPVIARPLPTEEANATFAYSARLYYRRDVPIWQVILCDKDRHWPWEAGVSDTFRQGQCPLVDWRLVGPPKE